MEMGIYLAGDPCICSHNYLILYVTNTEKLEREDVVTCLDERMAVKLGYFATQQLCQCVINSTVLTYFDFYSF